MKPLNPLLLAAAMLFVAAASLPSQAQLAPTQSQYKKLEAEKRVVMKLQEKGAALQARQGYEFMKLLQSCREVIVQNHWPADTQCDAQTLVFNQRPAPQPPVQQQPTPAAKPAAPSDPVKQ